MIINDRGKIINGRGKEGRKWYNKRNIHPLSSVTQVFRNGYPGHDHHTAVYKNIYAI